MHGSEPVRMLYRQSHQGQQEKVVPGKNILCIPEIIARVKTIGSESSVTARKELANPSAAFHLFPMHLGRLRLRDFRNYARLDVEFTPGFHLLLGDNAMGKTNVLEAIYLMATLRSFRGVGGAQMIRHSQTGYFVGGKVIGHGTHEIKMYWSQRERKLSLDGQIVRKLSDYLGVLRAVVFCTEDLQLVKGAARGRRRFLDLLLSQTHPTYLALLQRYARALRSRNALLKQRLVDEDALESFTVDLVTVGEELIRLRRQLAPRLSPLARLAYRRISNDAEELRLEYIPSVKKDFTVELAQTRSRERIYRSTLVGPHRDDLQLFLNERSAAQYGSEGQKRTLAIALKMAQAEYLTGLHGTPPILLLDDVMGELDLKRRSGLMPLLEGAHQARGQVFMTCTAETWPRELGRDLQRWHVQQGTLRNTT
jgi:DNA replication and repair protein RecF